MDEVLRLDLDEELEGFLDSILRSEGALLDSVLTESSEEALRKFDFSFLGDQLDHEQYVTLAAGGSVSTATVYVPTPKNAIPEVAPGSPDADARREPQELPTFNPAMWDGGILWDPTAVEVERGRTTISVRAFGVVIHVPTKHVLRYRKWKVWGPNGKILLRWTPALELKPAKLIIKRKAL